MLRAAAPLALVSILAPLALAQAEAPTPPVYATPQVGELRGIWAHATSTRTPAECDRVLDSVRDAGLNCIYWLGFYWGGQCWFRNPYVPMPSEVAPGFDPLDYLIREGHRRGIEIHLRFVNGENGSQSPGPFLGAHPDWGMVNSEGKRLPWYDFANKEVRDFQTALMVGTVRDYPQLDGIQFDFIRYDDGAGSFSPAACAGFAEQSGIHWETSSPALPTLAPLRANPLTSPTTGIVLARFGNGTPAIVGNNVGQGGALLLNWHAETGPFPLVSTLIGRALKAAGYQTGPVAMLKVPESAEWWVKYRAAAEDCVTRAGFTWEWRGADALAARPQAVVLPNCYRMPQSLLEALCRYAEQGGWVIVLDGPIYSIAQPACQKLLGLSSEGKYLAGLEAILPGDERTSLLDIAREVTPEERERYTGLGDRWRAFQIGCIDDLVGRVHEGAHRIRPDVAVTACVFHRRSSAESLYQHWHDWVRDGRIDYAVTMAYTADNDSLRQSMREWLATDPARARIVPGLGIYDIDGDGVRQVPASVLTQMKVLREEGGYPSVVFFAWNQLGPELSKALRGGPFASLAPRTRPSWGMAP